jgi:hypothetical protein
MCATLRLRGICPLPETTLNCWALNLDLRFTGWAIAHLLKLIFYADS